jgi:protein-L-isoaspartate(D-aspartate) O-methyltransferase
MATPSARHASGNLATHLTAAFRLLADEREANVRQIEAGVRRILEGAQRAEARRVLEAAWDDPAPDIRRASRRLACRILVEDVERRLTAHPDPDAEGRFRMVRDQLLPHGIGDPRVVRAMLETPREAFVPEPQRGQAHQPYPVAIGGGQTISQPYIVACMTEALGLRGHEKVLEIGTGSGYQTAILARTARAVFSVEILDALARGAAEILGRLGHANVRLRTADGHRGWPEAAPFDAVIVTCAPADVPAPLTDQLREGGRLVAPVGGSPDAQHLIRITKERNALRRETLIAVRFVPMTGGGTPN